MMSNGPEADVELNFPSPSGAFSSLPIEPTMRLRLSRRNHALEISHFILPSSSSLLKNKQRATPLGEWTKKVFTLPSDGGLEALTSDPASSSSMTQEECDALLHLADCVVVCTRLEDNSASLSAFASSGFVQSSTYGVRDTDIPLWGSHVTTAAAGHIEHGYLDANQPQPPSFVLNEDAWRDTLHSAKHYSKSKTRATPRTVRRKASISVSSSLLPDSTYHESQKPRPTLGDANSLPPRHTPRTQLSSRATSTTHTPIPNSTRNPSVRDGTAPGFSPLIRRALRNALELDIPPSSNPKPTISATPRTAAATSAPRHSSKHVAPTPSRSTDTRFIPHLGWCIRRIGWSESNKPEEVMMDIDGAEEMEDNDVITYQVMFNDGTRLEVDAARRFARLTDQHGKTSSR